MLEHVDATELEGVRHGIKIATYIGKLIKPTSAWEYSKSKYFDHYMNTTHPDIKNTVYSYLEMIKYCKSQRTVNLSGHGIYLIQLIPFLRSIKNATWRSKSIFSEYAISSINALSNKQIIKELFISSFLFDKMYLSMFRATKQYSDATVTPIIQYLLKKLQLMSEHCGYFMEYLFSMNTLFDYDNCFSNQLQLDEEDLEYQFGKNIIIIISLSYLYDGESTFTNKGDWCLDGSTVPYLSDIDLISIITPIWNDIQENMEHIIDKQNLMLQFVLNLDIESFLLYIKNIKKDCLIIYQYLYFDCDYQCKYYSKQSYLQHIPNNTDACESTHGNGSRISRRNRNYKEQPLRMRVLAQSNKLGQFLKKLVFDSTKTPIVHYIFDHAMNINVLKRIKDLKEEKKEGVILQRQYMQKYMKLKPSRKRTKTHCKKKRLFSEMDAISETEMDDEHLMNEMEMELSRVTDDDSPCQRILAEIDINDNANCRRSSRTRPTVNYKDPSSTETDR